MRGSAIPRTANTSPNSWTVTAGNAAVFSTIRTLHEMSSDESWEYAEALRHADNVSETLRPYLTQKHGGVAWACARCGRQQRSRNSFVFSW